jgi:hypothetical protein
MTIERRELHGVIIDVDIAAEPPGSIPDDVEDFIRSNIEFLRERVNPIMGVR